jgi:hypothetical protein
MSMVKFYNNIFCIRAVNKNWIGEHSPILLGLLGLYGAAIVVSAPQAIAGEVLPSESFQHPAIAPQIKVDTLAKKPVRQMPSGTDIAVRDQHLSSSQADRSVRSQVSKDDATPDQLIPSQVSSPRQSSIKPDTNPSAHFTPPRTRGVASGRRGSGTR